MDPVPGSLLGAISTVAKKISVLRRLGQEY
jgi:hypothetical protein